MRKEIKLFPILMTLPLLMANSPMPMPVTEQYFDLEMSMTYLGMEPGRYDDQYRYELEVSNIGDEYAGIPYFYFYEEENNLRTFYYIYDYLEEPLFDHPAIAPGNKLKYKVYFNKEIANKDTYIVEAEYYTYPISSLSFSNSEIVKYKKDNKTYALKTDIKGTTDVYYGVIVDVEYKGEPYSFFMHMDNNEVHTFRTSADLDLSQIKVTGVHAYQDVVSSSRRKQVSTTLIIVASIFTVVLLAAILIPFLIISHKKGRKD